MTLRPILPLVIAAAVVAALMVVWWLHGWRAKGRTSRFAGGVRVVLALLAVGIALRPIQGQFEPRPLESNSDVLIMIDRTTSMGATDHAAGQHRMDGVAADLSELVQQIGGAQVSIILIDDEAQLAVPFTTDSAAVISFGRTIGWRNSKKAAGSDISVGVDLARQALERAAMDRPDHMRYFVYFGDGEQTVEGAPRSFAELREWLSGALVLGYGTSTGATMPVSPETDELVTVEGVAQKSVLDEKNLKNIAVQLGGEYLHRVAPGGLPELVPSEVRTEEEFVTVTEYYWILALLSVPPMLLLLVQSILGIRTARAELNPDQRATRRGGNR